MRRIFLPAVCLAALSAAVPPAGADDWPAWRGPDGTGVCKERDLPLHVFPWRPECREAGLAPGALYLIRPDTYVALAHSSGAARKIW